MAKKNNAKKTKPAARKTVEALTHDEASRKNIPTAEFQSVVPKEVQQPIRIAYERAAGGGEPDPVAAEKAGRNRDLDPQLVWRGKDEQDWSDLVVQAPPLFIQEKIHPKVLIDDLMRRTRTQRRQEEEDAAPLLFADLYADFNGLPDTDAKTEFYQHDANWTNRMILGDSLHPRTRRRRHQPPRPISRSTRTTPRHLLRIRPSRRCAAGEPDPQKSPQRRLNATRASRPGAQRPGGVPE